MDLLSGYREDNNVACRGVYVVNSRAFKSLTISKGNIYHRVIQNFIINMKKEDDSGTKIKSVQKKIVPIYHSILTDV